MRLYFNCAIVQYDTSNAIYNSCLLGSWSCYVLYYGLVKLQAIFDCYGSLYFNTALVSLSFIYDQFIA